MLAILPALDARAYDKPEPPPALRNMPPDNSGGGRAHLAYSALLGAGLNVVNPDHPWVNAALCFGVGVAKEAHDYHKGQPGYRHGLFSRKDLREDAKGCALGWGTIAGARLILQPRGFALTWEH
jgi:hypothetical protein